MQCRLITKCRYYGVMIHNNVDTEDCVIIAVFIIVLYQCSYRGSYTPKLSLYHQHNEAYRNPKTRKWCLFSPLKILSALLILSSHLTSPFLFHSSVSLSSPVPSPLLSYQTYSAVFEDLSKQWQPGCEINTRHRTNAALSSLCHLFPSISGSLKWIHLSILTL